jgi:hypothetical protein
MSKTIYWVDPTFEPDTFRMRAWGWTEACICSAVISDEQAKVLKRQHKLKEIGD